MSGRREAKTTRREAGLPSIPDESGSDRHLNGSDPPLAPDELAPTKRDNTAPKLGRPPRQIHNPDLEVRIAANRRQAASAEHVLEQRDALAREALNAGYPIRRVAELTGMSRRVVERLGAQR